MDTFTLDTSGAVIEGPRNAWDQVPIKWRWSDLNPFTQGYVEAAFASQGGLYWAGAKGGERMTRGFRDLAPEALALMMRDCKAFLRAYPPGEENEANPKNDAWYFWKDRQNGLYADDFRPLTLYLGDDGRIYLREAT